MRLAIMVASAMLFAAYPVAAQHAEHAEHAEPVCPADAAPPSAPLAGWAHRTALTAVADPDGLAGAAIRPGMAVDLALLPTPDVRYPLRSQNPGGSVSHGGLVGFAVETAGTYRVALGGAAWIDVVRDGAAVASIGHGHGPACSGIRKIVDFSLAPGRYVVQIAGSGSSQIALMIAHVP